ncbi:MAG: peptidoglycan DD-metalloendopeptidase family protein [Patescibacteria group bacterium]
MKKIILLASILLCFSPFVVLANGNLVEIQAKLKEKQQAYDDLQSKIDIYEENIKSKQNEAATLNSQLEVIDQNTELTKSEIEQTTVEIDSLGLEIDSLQININDTEDKLVSNKEYMNKMIRDLYDYDQQTYLEISLSHATLSDFSTQVEYTETINTQFKDATEQLRQLKDQLKQTKQDKSEKQAAEQQKKQDLVAQQETLVGEAMYKEGLLSTVQNDESKFQQLIKDVRAEQDGYNAEISRLEKSARETYSQHSGPNNTSTTDTLPSEFDPMWPVSGTITATFHDPSYPFRAYFQHDAVDIGVPQGTPIKAADSGVVSVVRFDGSTNFAYVLIVHADNFATLYGHVSAVYVQPEEIVQKGQTIALSGAMPGTPGAGPYTTGPHLHFSVRLNGIPVDPLLYLP